MINKQVILRIIYFALGILFINQAALAGPDQPVVKTLNGNLNQLKANARDTVQDDKFFDPSLNSKLIKPYQVRNKVTLKVDEHSTYFAKSSFSATVNVRIYGTQANLTVDSLDRTLSIYYDNGGSAYTNMAGFVFSGRYRVIVKILDTTSGANWNVWNLLYIENELQSYPVFNFSCTGDAVQSVSNASLSSSGSEDELPVSWGNIISADQYDLEWTYVDSSALANGIYGTPTTPDPNLIFANNTSRVTIAANAYNIPMLYDGSGTLFYRVRSLQLQSGGGRTEAHWSSDYVSSGGLGSFVFKGHSRPLNWQATTTFAEEGKRKTVVQYYDGSLRGRQTVTKDNSTNTTIVAETYYDYQGRPGIQVMPAPTLKTVIGYSRNFNLGLNGAYDKSDFDSLVDPSVYCSATADSMKSDSGAAQYYSAKNPLKDTGASYNRFIPDAQGYPFTQTLYTQDNTGRISKQGGVGPTYQLGSGHETMYFYGTPDQHQLDGLFGTEVGDKLHYFKTMVRDANGQYSVSYADMHGRTIATALSGTPDSVKLDKLSSNISDSITESIADSSSNTIKDLVMESKKALLVPVAGTHIFTYSLTPQSLLSKACDSSSVCYSCLYNLEITITDDCNNQKLGGHAYDTLLQNFTLASLPVNCTGNSGFSFSFSKYLLQGSYDITKKLSISKYGSDYYRDSVFLKKNTCHNLAATISQQTLLQTSYNSQCQPSCKACTDSLGSYSSFYTRFMQKAGIANTDTAANAGLALYAYQQAQADCKALCDSTSEYDDVLAEMLLDLTPTGQYANPDSSADKYSIFYTNIAGVYSGTDTSHHIANYQKPAVYLNDAGKPDSVYDESSGTVVIPQQLSPEAFAEIFKTSWAQSLLPYHPEYCKLQQYQLLAASALWDKRFGATDSYDSAMSKGYLNPTHNVSGAPFTNFNAIGTSDYDPLASYGAHNYATDLNSILSNFTNNALYNNSYRVSASYTMWAVATANVKCPNGGSTCITSYGSRADSLFNGNMCAGDKDMAWRNFRQFYLDVKRQLINVQLKSSCSAPTATTLFAAGHQPHFSDNNELAVAAGLTNTATTESQIKINANDSLAGYYSSTCAAYVKQWWFQLAPCNYTSADSLILVPQLIRVCMEGSDIDHPLGSSSVAPSSSYSFKSFEDVINSYNQGTSHQNISCTPYLITAPKPYDQQVIYGAKPLWTKPDSCECSSISRLYLNYELAQAGYSSFSDYLNKVYQTQMTDSVLSLLLGMCTKNYSSNCTYFQKPISLPPALQCSTGDVCVGCDRFKIVNAEFQDKYPNITPVANPSATDSVQLGYNHLYESFMNYKLGFSKLSAEYLSFRDSCNSHAGTGLPTFQGLDSLTTLEQNFITYNGKSPHPDAGGCDTTNWKLNFGDTFYDNLGVPLNQVFVNGIAKIPDSFTNTVTPSNDVHIDFDHIYDTLCVDSNYVIEFKVKLPDSLIIPNFYNASFWITLYGDTAQAGSILVGLSKTVGNAILSHINETRQTVVQNPAANTSFNNYRVVKFSFTGHTLREYIDDTLVLIASLTSSMTKLYGFTINEWALKASFDYVRVYDSASGKNYYYEEFKGCDSIAHGLPAARCGDCHTAFVNYFNAGRGTSYTSSQVDSVYIANYGRLPNVCPVSSSYNCDSLAKYYNFYEANYDSLVTIPCHYSSADSSTTLKLTCCQQKFTSYINAKLGTALSYQQIYSLYATCNVAVNPCSQPVTGPTLCGRAAPVFSPVTLDAISNCNDSTFFGVSKGTEIFNGYQDSLRNIFDSSYRSKCLNAYKFESFTVRHLQSEYHYTLYYYDQAGNLVKTVPPAGVNANFTSGFLDSVQHARTAGQTKVPSHTLITQYRYNTLNQIVAQKSPDGGQSNFWYDRLGRLAISQNAKQKAASATETGRPYSYTVYDQIGRINEVGQISNTGSTAITDSISRSQGLLSSWLSASVASKEQITQTVYDTAYTGFTGYTPAPITQHNLRNRVAYTSYTNGNNPYNYNQATFFAYDIEGNVDTLLQDYGNAELTVAQNMMNKSGNRFKVMTYNYDLISGKVLNVAYQPYFPDQFFHKYTYDAENRLILAETSADSITWETDARYTYYKHGPLARMVLGDQQVQGLDYAYTLQGWLKGVNSTSLRTVYDMGRDGDTSSTNPNRYVARDLFGYNLNYYTSDYKPVSSGFTPFAAVGAYLNNAYRPLYNGNINSMAVNIWNLSAYDSLTPWVQPLLYNYTYDQLNRITGMNSYYGLNQNTNSWSAMKFTPNFRERVQYDPNGNISSYIRNGYGYYPSDSAKGFPMDSLYYGYNAATNQLNHVQDKGYAYQGGDYDIHDQPANNYAYDPIGNLIKDSIEKINKINWNVYGKITEIDHSSVPNPSYNPVKNIYYSYDAAGNRIGKKSTLGNSATVNYTWYVRDASGNVMSSYTANADSSSGLTGITAKLENNYLYGSSRLGMYARGFTVDAQDNGLGAEYTPWGGSDFNFYRGGKQYELSNHLGNVIVTINDIKLGTSQVSNSSLIDHFNAFAIRVTDYYPFGMEIPGRSYNGSLYRYGFNGKENDNEVKGEANQIDYGMRVYDPRTARFLSNDPLQKQYAMFTPYQFASNSPIANIDLDGKEAKYFNVVYYETYNAQSKLINSTSIRMEDKAKAAGLSLHFPFFRPSGKLGEGVLTTFSLVTTKIGVDGNESITSKQLPSFYEPGNAKEKGRGGLYLVSKDGSYGNASGDLEKDDAIPIPIDLLAKVIGGFPENDNLMDGIKEIFTADKFSETALKTLETIKNAQEATENVKGTIENIKNMVGEKTEGENDKATNQIQILSNPPSAKSSQNKLIFKREDDYGTGPKREKKGSVQNHAYVNDKTDSIKGDTFYIKQPKK